MKSLAVAFGAALAPASAAAEQPRWDPGHATTASLPGEAGVSDERGTGGGVYGRFDGDLTLAASAGVELASDPNRVFTRLGAYYYSMAGLYASLRAPLTKDGESSLWVGSAGVDIMPVFIPRWSMDLERGPAWLDLMLDSLAISAGTFLGLGKSGASTRPAGFELGLGAGLPLLASAEGPWFEARYLLSWRHAGGAEGSVWLALSWHFLVDTPLSSQTGALDY